MQGMKTVSYMIYGSGLLLLLACDNDESNDTHIRASLTVTETDYNNYLHLDASGSSAQAPYQITQQSILVTDDTGQVVFEHVFEDEDYRVRKHFDQGSYNAVLTTTASATASDDDTSDLISSSSVNFSVTSSLCEFSGNHCLWSCSFNDDAETIISCIPSDVDDDNECHYDSLSTLVDNVNTGCAPDHTFDTSTTMWLRAYGANGGDHTGNSSEGRGGFAQTITTLDDLAAQFGNDKVYFAIGENGTSGDGNGGAATIISAIKPRQTGSGDDLSYYFEMADIIAVAGGGGAAANNNSAGDGGHAASMRVGYCAASKGGDAHNSDANDGYGGGSDIYDEDISNNSDYCTDYDALLALAISGSKSGNSGVGGDGGGGKGWINHDDLTKYWGGDGNGGHKAHCSGGGGFGGGGHGDDSSDLGGGGGSFAMAPTTVDGDAFDSDSTNHGDGYIAVVFNRSPSSFEGYCGVSCSGYGEADEDDLYTQARCQLVDITYDTHECNSLSLSYVIDSLNDMAILNDAASSSSSIWLRAYGAKGNSGEEVDVAGAGDGGSGGIAQTLVTVESYQAQYGTDNIYFLLGDTSDNNGGSGTATLVLTSPGAYDADLDLASTLLVAGAGGGGGNAYDTTNGGNAGNGAVAASYIEGECSVTKGGDADDSDGGGGGGSTLASYDTQYCDLSDSDNAALILSLATGGEGKGKAGSSGIGGLGATHSNAGNGSWTNNAGLSANWIGSGNGGQGEESSSSSGASGAGGGGFGGGAGGNSQSDKRGSGGGGGGSYAASPLLTDYAACDTGQDDCGLSKNTKDSDYSGVGYIELIINLSPQTSDP